MKKFLLPFLCVFVLGSAVSCSDDDGPGIDPPVEGSEITKSGAISANETWTAENVYILDGKVVVSEGATLTIEPGTIIKGAEGQATQLSALVIDQGAKLMANGTAEKPIIFTSVLDDIQPGQKQGTNLDFEDTGLWGGVIVLGRAPISVSGDLGTAQVEGIPANESYGQYGGTDAADNSGSLTYISIRHGGGSIATDNEINGLTLGGVGSGTTISNIEIVANQDDGIEWFGGTVNVTNIISTSQGDDGFDIDQAYSGKITNGLVIQGSESGSAFELDGPEGSAATEGSAFTMENMTVIGGGTSALIADLRDGVICNLNNVLVYDIASGSGVKINGADSQAEFTAGRITFSGWQVLAPTGVTVDQLITGAAGSTSSFTSNVSLIGSADEATIGADLAAFAWTYAAAKGSF